MSIATTQQVLIRELTVEDQPLLAEMYERYLPHGEVMGLPPHDPDRRREWLAQLREGVNCVAFVGGTLAGHVAMMPEGGRGELVVFVREEFRRQGIGTAITTRAVEAARSMGLKAVWVLINGTNVAAYRGLCKFGFHPEWETLHEAQMVYEL